jgi:schlafen family protein
MGTFELPINLVTGKVLERLRDDKIKEGLQLEYKESLPTEKTREKFLTSITSFANSSGGDLIYGLRAKRDEDGVPTGEIDSIVGLPSINPDQEILRLQQWIRDCIDPPLITVIELIDRENEAPCLIVRVPPSWTTLHMVKTMDNPFYGRHSGGKYRLSTNEIRDGFIMAITARDRVRQFRDDRVERILQGKTPTNLGSDPKIVFHALPLNVDDSAWVRFRETERASEKNPPILPLRLNLISGHQQNWHYNTDGFLIERMESRNSYVQMFRDCGIEAVDESLLKFYGLDDKDDDLKIMHGINIERGVIRAFSAYQKFLSWIGIAGPFALYLTLIGVRGIGLVALADHYHRRDFVGIDRDCVMTSDVVVDDLTTPADVVLKPLFDFVWNASGYAESPHYKNGRWTDKSP